MTLKIRLSNKAVNDLKNIGRYSEGRWGREQRNTYLSTLDTGIRRLSENPLAGSPCDDILSGYWKYRVGKHLIFYRYDSSHIHIVRILHERMDVVGNLDL